MSSSWTFSLVEGALAWVWSLAEASVFLASLVFVALASLVLQR